MTTLAPSSPKLLQLGLGWFPETHGGAENIFYQLANRLPDLGFRLRGLVLGSERIQGDTGGRVSAFASPTASLGKRLTAARSAVRHAIRTDAPDLVASHFALNTVTALSALEQRPLVVHFHGPWALESAAEGASGVAVRVKLAIERRVYGRATRFIVLSRAFFDILHRVYGVPAERIRLVAGGIDAARFAIPDSREAARERLGWPPDRPVIVTVRRLVRRMGVSQLIDAMADVTRRVPDALLLIAGRGPEAAELDARIRALGLENHVRLLGFVPDDILPLIYRAADLSVVPSQSLEGFGLTTLESLAAGTPVLVTPVGGMPEIVHDLNPGLILEDKKPAAIAAGLTAALAGYLRLPETDTCRTFVRIRYDWPVIARRVGAVYREALQG
jgi:glycosyltransferase involved in cell wall biosynthesis